MVVSEWVEIVRKEYPGVAIGSRVFLGIAGPTRGELGHFNKPIRLKMGLRVFNLVGRLRNGSQHNSKPRV